MKAIRVISALAILLVPSAVAAQGRWNTVPALPTGCYTKGEQFLTEVESAMAANIAAANRQEAANQAVRDRVAAMSDDAKQAALMRYLTSNPANATSYMQDMTTAGEAQVQREAELVTSNKLLDDKWAAVVAQYETERPPIDSMYLASLHEYEPGGDPVKARTLTAAFNTAYEAFCRKWFLSSNSPFLNHLVELRRHLVQKAIPFDAENVRIEKLQYSIWGVPTGSYDTKEEYYAVNNYLSRLKDIFGRRRIEPARTP